MNLSMRLLTGGLRRRLWLGLALLFAGESIAAAQTIDSVRLHRAPDHTRIVFDLQGPVDHQLSRLANPERIVLDLEDAEISYAMHRLNLANSPVTGVRVGKHEGNRTRVVFDMDVEVRPRTNLLRPVAPHGWRLVLDLVDSDPTPVKSMERVISEQDGPRPMIVAIDPGHGGEDPGAIGPSGVYEKDVVLQIARRLHRLMEKEPGIQPVLIRTGDYYVPLAERRRIAAEKHNADVFLSIHADAFTDPRANGASVFALSTRGATSARARYLARIANDSDRVAGVPEEERGNTGLMGVLADMTLDGSMSHSHILGRQLVDEMARVTKLHGDRRRVEGAGFAVLQEPSMVSLLVETGFISNPTEERNLRSSAHQEKLAQSMVNGVKRYFEQHPKPGSWYAARRRSGGETNHRIQSGETLSSIARRYSVSESALRSVNNINGDLIRVGQELRIPE